MYAALILCYDFSNNKLPHKERKMVSIKNPPTDGDNFARHCGIQLVAVSPGYAQAQMCLSPVHHNGVGIAHGGVLFTLADFTFAAAVNSHGRIAVGINASIAYLQATKSGILTAEATENSLSNKLGNYTVNIRNEQDQLIAIFQGTAYRKKEEHIPLAE
jgi:acyl-CoA thioesterase